jgi:hypothetical protein
VRRLLGDALLSACALAILLVGLIVMDGRVREEVSMTMDGARASTQIAATTGQARRLARVVVGVVKEQSDEHRPLMIMLVVGTVLTVVMFRT